MTHLTPDQIVEAADVESSAGTRFPHLTSCDECGAAVEELRRATATVREAGAVPEPSPLFWDHFAQRVRAATEAEPVPHRAAWRRLVWTPAVAAAATIAVTLVGWQIAHRSADAVDGGNAAQVAAAGAPEPTPDSTVAEAAPADWIEAAGLAEALAPESVVSLVPPTGDVFLAEELNDRELQEFARLLRAQMGGVE